MTDYSDRPHWLAYSQQLSPMQQPVILWASEYVQQYRDSGWDVTGPYAVVTESDAKAMRAGADERHAE
jgi:hypothetical protein